jgi:hypothetical protein
MINLDKFFNMHNLPSRGWTKSGITTIDRVYAPLGFHKKEVFLVERYAKIGLEIQRCHYHTSWKQLLD